MEIELLTVADCPHAQPAADQVRRALAEVGPPEAVFTTRVIKDPDDAERSGFAGSPTVLVNGRAPFAQPGQLPGMTCRVYQGPQGLSGIPPLAELRQALREAAAAS
ncbi:hypothetical protein [Streptomyces sp. NPDC059008]|uniref:hypothetical protein n=1 Tax=Streptomyces sp. NPDC059008 TaxID=3346693 RepID=UPI0036A1DEC9